MTTLGKRAMAMADTVEAVPDGLCPDQPAQARICGFGPSLKASCSQHPVEPVTGSRAGLDRAWSRLVDLELPVVVQEGDQIVRLHVVGEIEAARSGVVGV